MGIYSQETKTKDKLTLHLSYTSSCVAAGQLSDIMLNRYNVDHFIHLSLACSHAKIY